MTEKKQDLRLGVSHHPLSARRPRSSGVRVIFATCNERACSIRGHSAIAFAPTLAWQYSPTPTLPSMHPQRRTMKKSSQRKDRTGALPSARIDGFSAMVQCETRRRLVSSSAASLSAQPLVVAKRAAGNQTSRRPPCRALNQFNCKCRHVDVVRRSIRLPINATPDQSTSSALNPAQLHPPHRPTCASSVGRYIHVHMCVFGLQLQPPSAVCRPARSRCVSQAASSSPPP
jgi:hypothetical protein